MDCLNQDLRDFMDFRDGSCPPAQGRPYESSREISESRQVFTSEFTRLCMGFGGCGTGSLRIQRGSARRVTGGAGGSGLHGWRWATPAARTGAKRVVRIPGSCGCERQCQFTDKIAVRSVRRATRYRDKRSSCGCGVLELGGHCCEGLATVREILKGKHDRIDFRLLPPLEYGRMLTEARSLVRGCQRGGQSAVKSVR